MKVSSIGNYFPPFPLIPFLWSRFISHGQNMQTKKKKIAGIPFFFCSILVLLY